MARKSHKNLDTATVEIQFSPAVYNAAAYVRLSSDAAKKRGDSLETQWNIIENYVAASPDIRIAEVYEDNAKTGTNFERAGFQKMLADCESGKINCILVKDLTRFGRNAIDAGYYLEKYLPSLGVRFIAVTDGFDTNESDGGILLPLKNVISEAYALDISRKCKSVQRQNIADGRFVGRMAPYGYAKSPLDCHKLIVDSDAAPIVRQIFAWAHSGASVGEVARRLNEASVLTPSRYKLEKGVVVHNRLVGTEHWQRRTVANILTDHSYIGDLVQGKTRTVNHKEIAVPQSEWVCVPNTHEPIISRELFDAVQKMSAYNSAQDAAKRQSQGAYTPSVFGGKIFCARCGHPMHRHRQNKDGTYWFRCQSQWKLQKDVCVVVSVKEAELKSEMLAMLRKQSAAILGRYVTLDRAAIPARDSADAELREINRELDKSGRMLRSLYENMVSDIITRDEFVQMKVDYETKIAALSVRADAIRSARSASKAQAAEAYSVADATSAILSDDILTAELVERVVDKILVHPDKSFEIFFKFDDEFGEAA